MRNVSQRLSQCFQNFTPTLYDRFLGVNPYINKLLSLVDGNSTPSVRDLLLAVLDYYLLASNSLSKQLVDIVFAEEDGIQKNSLSPLFSCYYSLYRLGYLTKDNIKRIRAVPDSLHDYNYVILSDNLDMVIARKFACNQRSINLLMHPCWLFNIIPSELILAGSFNGYLQARVNKTREVTKALTAFNIPITYFTVVESLLSTVSIVRAALANPVVDFILGHIFSVYNFKVLPEFVLKDPSSFYKSLTSGFFELYKYNEELYHSYYLVLAAVNNPDNVADRLIDLDIKGNLTPETTSLAVDPGYLNSDPCYQYLLKNRGAFTSKDFTVLRQYLKERHCTIEIFINNFLRLSNKGCITPSIADSLAKTKEVEKTTDLIIQLKNQDYNQALIEGFLVSISGCFNEKEWLDVISVMDECQGLSPDVLRLIVSSRADASQTLQDIMEAVTDLKHVNDIDDRTPERVSKHQHGLVSYARTIKLMSEYGYYTEKNRDAVLESGSPYLYVYIAKALDISKNDFHKRVGDFHLIDPPSEDVFCQLIDVLSELELLTDKLVQNILTRNINYDSLLIICNICQSDDFFTSEFLIRLIKKQRMYHLGNASAAMAKHHASKNLKVLNCSSVRKLILTHDSPREFSEALVELSEYAEPNSYVNELYNYKGTAQSGRDTPLEALVKIMRRVISNVDNFDGAHWLGEYIVALSALGNFDVLISIQVVVSASLDDIGSKLDPSSMLELINSKNFENLLSSYKALKLSRAKNYYHIGNFDRIHDNFASIIWGLMTQNPGALTDCFVEKLSKFIFLCSAQELEDALKCSGDAAHYLECLLYIKKQNEADRPDMIDRLKGYNSDQLHDAFKFVDYYNKNKIVEPLLERERYMSFCNKDLKTAFYLFRPFKARLMDLRLLEEDFAFLNQFPRESDADLYKIIRLICCIDALHGSGIVTADFDIGQIYNDIRNIDANDLGLIIGIFLRLTFNGIDYNLFKRVLENFNIYYRVIFTDDFVHFRRGNLNRFNVDRLNSILDSIEVLARDCPDLLARAANDFFPEVLLKNPNEYLEYIRVEIGRHLDRVRLQVLREQAQQLRDENQNLQPQFFQPVQPTDEARESLELTHPCRGF